MAPVTTAWAPVYKGGPADWPHRPSLQSAGPTAAEILFRELGVDPVHLGAQLLAHDLDLVARLLIAHALEVLLAGAVLGDPLAGEVTGLDLGQDVLHGLAR